nr:F-box/FBD/LRR-repeat protein At1g13570-like [Ipomoea batatas]
METTQYERTDLISELSIELKHRILECLSTRYVSRMAMLSTIWKNVWLQHGRLVFDQDFFESIRKYVVANSTSAVNIINNILLLRLNKVLNQHNGLIRTFVVNFQGNTRKSLRSRSFDIDQWFLFVTRKGVEDIFLSFMVGDDYRFPSYIFSCPTLRVLYLDTVSIKLCAYCTLPNVTSLVFKNIDFHGVDLPDPVDFPLLQNLSFIRCYNLPNLKITAKILDILVLNDSHFYYVPIYSNLRSLRVLELDCYSLVVS